jgi:hypothetical protein
MKRSHPMLPEAYVCHRTLGRLRIRVPSERGNDDFFSRVMTGFAGMGGIDRVDINLTTASVLFITKTDADAIAQYAAENGLFKLHGPSLGSTTLSRKIAGDFKSLNERVKQFTGGDLDVPGLAFLGLLGVGIYQISIGNFTAPAWYTAFWYSLNVFIKGQAD